MNPFPAALEPLAFEAVGDAEADAHARTFLALMRRRTVRDLPPPGAARGGQGGRGGGGERPVRRHPAALDLRPHRGPRPKARIREAAEAEERAFDAGRAGPDWLEALAPLGTDWRKPFLEVTPWLIVVFAQRRGLRPDGRRVKHDPVSESVGISRGLLIAALHGAGLATLTHTPSPMGFLNRICGRPEHERAVMIVAAGHPAPDCRVARIAKKKGWRRPWYSCDACRSRRGFPRHRVGRIQ
jgi:hypothetical protein